VNGAVRLGRFAGVDVVADASTFLLGLLFGGVVFVYIGQTVPNASAEIGANASAEIGVLFAALAGVAVIGCVFLHEASHVVVALRRGLAVRSIRLYVFGGYSVIDGAPTPRTELLVSIAGPASSVLIGLVMMIVPRLAGTDNLVGATLWALGLANLAIGVFNLLPGFPLDGGRIVRSILSQGGRDRIEATRIVTTIGRVIGFATMGVGVFLLLARQTTGLFWLFVGWFLATTAVSAGRREELSTLRSLPVEMTGRVVGVIGQEEIDSISSSRWPSIRVRALMSGIGPADVVEADEPFESLLLRPAGASGRAVVVRDGIVVGIIDGQALGSVL